MNVKELELGKELFYRRAVDEETGEEYDEEIPACRCTECGEAIYKDDDCLRIYSSEVTGLRERIICAACMDFLKTKGGRIALDRYEEARRKVKI